jgi:dihydroorotase
VDPEATWQIDSSAFVSKSHNTPFDGDTLKGRVMWTMKGGQIVYDYGSTL